MTAPSELVHTNDALDDDNLWFAGAGRDLISKLKTRRAMVNRIRVVLFERELRNARPACPVVEAFLMNKQWWSTVPEEHSSAILASPWFDHWAYLADCCRQRFENGESVTFSDLPSYRSFGGTDDAAIEWLLKDFGRFSAELAVLAGREVQGSALLWDSRFPLSYWGATIQCDSAAEVAWSVSQEDRSVVLQVDGNRGVAWTRTDGSVTWLEGGSRLHTAPRIRRAMAHGIHLSDADPLVRREWIDVYVNPDGSTYLPPPADLTEFLDHYSDGLALIDRYMPALGADIADGLHTIIPVGKPAPDRGVSCSSDTFFGAILCCDNPPVLAAEVLIHEFGHNVFNELIARDQVFATALSADEVLYSPWREDPRPILGLFHAAFVFERVSQWYARYTAAHSSDADALHRFRLLLACTRIACRSLATADAYQTFGWQLLQGMIERTDRLSRLPGAALQDEERSAIDAHFRAWCARNPALAERNRFDMPA
jgi:HEXXH motif-containing protein